MPDLAKIESRAVAPAQGWAWIATAFALVKRAPGPWIGVFVLWIAINLLASVIPLGGLATTLLGPVFTGGWMLGCRSVDRGGELKVEHLFAAFRSDQLGPLVLVGAIYLGGLIAAMMVVALAVGGSMMPLLFGKADPTQIQLGLGVAVGLLLLVALMVPLVMAMWFAPALVIFRSQAPVEAMRASLNACWRNVVPFLLYGLIVLVLAIVASIPLFLGFLVLGPIVVASIYTSYCDVFEDRGFAAATPEE